MNNETSETYKFEQDGMDAIKRNFYRGRFYIR